ncbi:MAG: acyl--CoA ligase family protein [Chloroflexota bacterium]
MNDFDGACYQMLTPVRFLKRTVETFPDREGVVYGTRRYTYRDFYDRVVRLANALTHMGVRKNDCVAFMCPNTPPLLEAHFALPWIGGMLLTVNIRLAPREIEYILNHSAAKVLVVDTEYMPTIESIKPNLSGLRDIVQIVDTEPAVQGYAVYEELLAGAPAAEPALAIDDENDILSLNYTSGTTGQPKGVMYSHRGAYLNSLGDGLEADMDSDSVYLWILPMFHCNGWCFTWAVTATGGRHVCLRKVDPAAIADLIHVENVTHMCGTPTVFLMLSQHMIDNGMRFQEGTKVILGGAPPSPTLIDRMESLGADITHTYGLTETYGPFSICEWHSEWDTLSLDERARLKARQGVPYITSYEMRVVDEQLREVPHDGSTLGEIVMRGNNVMRGYYRDPDKTAEAFRGGWFHSGDLAVVHPDGYVEIKDRGKDIVISGGENISTVEVENVIYQHPSVLEVAVVATPDEKWGEVPKAIINPKPGMSLTEEEVIAFCRERMAHFKAPKHVEFGELPRTSTGKIMKYVLKQRERQGRNATSR